MESTYAKIKWPIFFLFLVCIIQFLFVQFYWNDKTTTVAHIVQSMQANHTVYAKDLACYNENAGNGKYSAWAEEPPIFHYTTLFLKVLLNNYSLRIVPLLCYFFSVLGILFFVKTIADKQSMILLSLYLIFVPSLYIHAMRLLPDVLSMTLMIWGMYFFLRKKFAPAWFFLLLAVSVKVLAIIPLFFFCLTYLFISRREISFKKILILLSFGLTVIPTTLWFYYLKTHSIENPFFQSNISIAHHAGGTDLSILLVKKYWSKIFQWYFYRGIGILSFVLFFYHLLTKHKTFTFDEKLLSYSSLFFILNVILFRGPQMTAPWYSFYFQVLFLMFISLAFLKLSKKTQLIMVMINLFISIGFLSYGKFKEVGFNDSSTELPCHFHEWAKDKNTLKT